MPALSDYPNYRLNCGQYVLYHGDRPVSAPLEELALLIDREDGYLQRFGKPETVNQWLSHQRALLARTQEDNPNGDHSFLEERIAALVVLQGRFALDDVNRCLANPAAAGGLYEMAMNGTLQSLDLLGRPRQLDALLA